MGRKRRGPKCKPLSASQEIISEFESDSIYQRSTNSATEVHTVSLPAKLRTMSTKIQMDQFESPESLRQLKVIDALRELGLGHDISLPQVSSSKPIALRSSSFRRLIF